MTIQSIEEISQYGIFSKCSRNSTKSFSQNNIIFGWNYCGKTTLSRIFRSVERHTTHPDYPNGKFRIMCSDGSEITEANLAENHLTLRVFNSDYIQENLKWDRSTGDIAPILIVGEENIKLQEEMMSLAAERQQLLEKQRQVTSDKVAAVSDLDTAMTQEALRITTELLLQRNFRRPNLQVLLDSDNVSDWLLSESEFGIARETALSSHKLDPLTKVSLSIEDSLFQRTAEMLSKCVTPSKVITKLKQDPTLESWVRNGRALHEKELTCQFCGNALPEDLLSSLDAHFSKDYEAFRKEVEDFISALDNNRILFSSPDKNALYRDLQEDYQIRTKAVEEEVKNYNTFIDRLKEKALEKKNHLADTLAIDVLVSHDCSRLSEWVMRLNERIEQHNQRTAGFDRIKEEAVESLKKHYAAQFFTKLDYKKQRNDIQSRTDEIAAMDVRIKEIDREIQQLLVKVSETAKGAESLNAYLTRYFGKDSPISICVGENDIFRVYRGEALAKNLSEGEKTAISFAHFITALNDKNTKDALSETIVYIDDPVSSLDRNHLYNTYALIASYLKDKCGQLFVSTHNFEFFNLLKEEFKRHHPKGCNFADRSNDVCKAPLYQIVRTKDNAVIKNLDCILCHFNSEYFFLFYQLCEYRADNSDEYKRLTIPNLLRRFLETYFAFIHPVEHGLANNLPKLFPDTEMPKLVHKILDEYSHSENIERVLQLHTTDEIVKAIEATFKALEDANPEYFRELKAYVASPI